jgi:hypothetical protein
MSDLCPVCKGERWVCEDHKDKPWNNEGCMCSAGVPCICNRGEIVENPPGFVVTCSIYADGTLQ